MTTSYFESATFIVCAVCLHLDADQSSLSASFVVWSGRPPACAFGLVSSTNMADFGELVLVLGDLHIPHRAESLPAQFKALLGAFVLPALHTSSTTFVRLRKSLSSLSHVFWFDITVPGKMQHVLCTGNVCSKSMDEYLHTLANSVHIVRGDMDDNSTQYPDTKVLQVGEFRIGLCHGHQIVPWGDAESLANMQRKLDVDVLITGHTHKNEIQEYEKKYIVNPGSITGAYSAFSTYVIELCALWSTVQLGHLRSRLVNVRVTDHYVPLRVSVSDVIPSFVLMAVKGSKIVTYVYELKGSDVSVSKSEFVKKDK